jgi:uncharacterized protein
MFRFIGLLVFAVLCSSLEGCSNESPRSASVAMTGDTANDRRSSGSQAVSRRGSEQTLAISAITGEENSTYSRTIVDLTEVLDRAQLRLQPVASQGPRQDLLSLLHRSNIDVAVMQTDVLEALPDHVQAAARERLRYVFRVPNKELHVLAPRDVTEVHQLEGRKVNIDRPGSGTHLTARFVFERLGIKPEFTTYDQLTARKRLQSGEIQAAILLAPRLSGEVLAFPSYGQFHLLPIPLEEGIRSYYPARFTADDYPHLVENGRPVETIAVGRVLAVREWREGSARHQHLTRLAEAIYSHFDELQQPGHDPGWRDVDPLAPAPGWQQFRPAQNLLDERAQQADERRAFERFAAASGMCSVPASPAAFERLYNDFMEWRKARDRTMSPRNLGLQ